MYKLNYSEYYSGTMSKLYVMSRKRSVVYYDGGDEEGLFADERWKIKQNWAKFSKFAPNHVKDAILKNT